MANNKLTFEIGSVFHGEGFRKANIAVSTLGASTKKATSAVTPLISSLGMMSGTGSKVVNAVSGISTAFAQLGVVGAVVAGAQVGIDAFFDHWKRQCDAMVARAKAAEAAVHQEMANDIAEALKKPADALSQVKTGAERAQKAFEGMAQAALKVSKAVAQTGIARGDFEVAGMEARKANGIIGFGGDTAGAATYAAARDIEIAEKKYANAVEEHAAKVNIAAKEAQDAATAERLVSEKLEAAKKAVAVAMREEGRLSHLRDRAPYERAHAMRLQAEELVATTARELAQKQADAKTALERRTQAEIAAAQATDAASLVVVQQKAAAEALAAAQRKAADKAALQARIVDSRIQGRGDEAIINGKLAEVRKQAEAWEEQFGGLRGKSMKEQQRALRDMANNRGKGGKGGDGWDGTTQAKELERLEKMANERRRTMTKGQLEKLEQLRNLRDIRKGGNPFEQQIKKLEDEKVRALGKMEQNIRAIEIKIAGLS